MATSSFIPAASELPITAALSDSQRSYMTRIERGETITWIPPITRDWLRRKEFIKYTSSAGRLSDLVITDRGKMALRVDAAIRAQKKAGQK